MVSSPTRPYWYRDGAPHTVGHADETGVLAILLLGFVCGAMAILPFQEGTLLVLHRMQDTSPLLWRIFGETPMPFRLERDALGLPQLLTEMLWGGCMGMPLAVLLCRGQSMPMLASGVFYGVGTVGGLLLVGIPLLRGMPVIGHASREFICLTLLLCAAWGWGTALLLKLITRR